MYFSKLRSEVSIIDTATAVTSADFPKSLIFDIGITSIDFGQRSKGVHVALEKLASDYCSLDDLAESGPVSNFMSTGAL